MTRPTTRRPGRNQARPARDVCNGCRMQSRALALARKEQLFMNGKKRMAF
jgi:hypothetical protein